MIIAAIPARLNSTRLPNKLLLNDTGKPLIWHTVQQVLRAKSPSMVFVLADDKSIADALAPFDLKNTKVILTGPASSGTERIANFARIMRLHDENIIVNFQGDEPELDGSHIDGLVSDLYDVDVATLASPASREEAYTQSVVKVIRDAQERAMYFSREPIPHSGPWLKHIGIYAYTAGFLKNFKSSSDHPAVGERLEQLEWLHYGAKIKVRVGPRINSVGIDTLSDYQKFVRSYRS